MQEMHLWGLPWSLVAPAVVSVGWCGAATWGRAAIYAAADAQHIHDDIVVFELLNFMSHVDDPDPLGPHKEEAIRSAQRRTASFEDRTRWIKRRGAALV